jgi:hypothetical protein
MTVRRARASTAAGVAFSVFWHILVLGVMVAEIHPFTIPDTQPVMLQLLPPLVPPPPIQIEPPPRLVPPKLEQPPKPVPPKPVEIQPPAPVPPTEAPPAPQPKPIVTRPVEVERPPAPVAPKVVQVEPPRPVLAAPAPTEPAPAPPKAIEVAPQKTIEAAPSRSVTVQQTTPAVPVLTNQQTVQAPVEIRPPDRPAGGQAAAAASTPPAAGSAPPPAGAAGAAKPPFNGPIVGFGNGLRMTLGCLNPETYHLTREERAECLRRVGEQAKTVAPMGPNIPADKLAEYDRQRACHDSYAGGATPSLGAESTDTVAGIRGLGAVPRLRDCGPGDR